MSSNTITLKTADNGVFEVPSSVAMEFGTVKSFFDENSDTSPDTIVPLPNVSSGPLSKIIDYIKKHLEFREKSTASDEVESYDENFVNSEDNDSIKEMILAANYLNIKELLDLLNQAVADRIKDKSVEYVRRFFGIENDFTPEEEARLREENAWAFEGVEAD